MQGPGEEPSKQSSWKMVGVGERGRMILGGQGEEDLVHLQTFT